MYEDPAEAVEAQEGAGLQPHPGVSPRAGWAPGTQIRSLPPLRSPGASFPPQEPPPPPPPPQCLPRCIQWGEEEEEEDQGRGGGLGREEGGGTALSSGSGAAGQVQVPPRSGAECPHWLPLPLPACPSVRPFVRLSCPVPSRPASGRRRRGGLRWRRGARGGCAAPLRSQPLPGSRHKGNLRLRGSPGLAPPLPLAPPLLLGDTPLCPPPRPHPAPPRTVDTPLTLRWPHPHRHGTPPQVGV